MQAIIPYCKWFSCFVPHRLVNELDQLVMNGGGAKDPVDGTYMYIDE